MSRKAIYKYQLEFYRNIQEIVIPKDGEIVNISLHKSVINMWVLCDIQSYENKIFDLRRFKIYETNEEVEGQYIGTIYIGSKDTYVFHVFEL